MLFDKIECPAIYCPSPLPSPHRGEGFVVMVLRAHHGHPVRIEGSAVMDGVGYSSIPPALTDLKGGRGAG